MDSMDPRAGADHDGERIKVVGRRTAVRGGIEQAAPLLDLVIGLRRNKPFIPRSVHRFTSFEESQAWSLSMMTRARRDRRP